MHLAFQSTSHATLEYVLRLKDEHRIIQLGERVRTYFLRFDSHALAARASAVMLEHQYYKHDSLHEAIRKAKEAEGTEMYPVFAIGELTTPIYKHGDFRMVARATLCHVYYLAIHDRYNEARDLLLMS